MKVKVRVAVAVDRGGNWCATGYQGLADDNAFDFILDSLEPGEARYFITAELDVPASPQEVLASIEGDPA